MTQLSASLPASEESPASAGTGAPPAVTFDALPLSADVRKAIDALGYLNPTPVQLAVFEPAVRGKSLVVQARTGTGKTAAFGLPIIDSLIRKSQPNVQALILTPTRELALQVGRELEKLGQFRGTKVVPIYGGAPMGKQIEALEGGAQVVVGTPGRVLDHLRRGTLDPKNIRIFVLDEADEMLSMGFAKELHAIIEHLPAGERQGLYFSATLPPDVERLAKKHLNDPEYVTLSSDQVGALQLAHFVYLVREGDKRQAILSIIEVEDPQSAVIFCNTKDETERVAEALKNRGYDADWLNGDLEQKERERVMTATREGKLRFLVATDVAARGIDISHLTHVINADFPESAEQYVHRTGRTGRAGRTGTAISVVGPKDVGHLYMLRLTYKIRPIERMLPTQGEIKTRAEADMVNFLVEAYAGRTASPTHRGVARRLFTHDQAESIVAGLLADHLGASATTDPLQDAAETRRAKNPPAVVAEANVSQSPRQEHTLTDSRRGGRNTSRDSRLRNDGPAPRDAAPRVSGPSASAAEPPRVSRAAHAPDRSQTEERAPLPQGPRTLRDGELPGDGRGPRRGGARDARRDGPRDTSGQGVPRDRGMGPREREAGARTEAPRIHARAPGREGVAQATLSDWEPPMDEDDDRPILASGSRRGGTSLSEMSVSMDEALTAVGLPDDLPQGSLSSGTDESRVSRESRARNNGNVSDTRAPRSPAIAERPLLPNLPGITEGEVLPAAAPARRGAGRGPTRERERVRGGGAERPRENGPSLETERFERPRTDAAVVVQRPPRDLDVRDVPDARDDASLSNIFLNVGRRDGVNPGDLQKLLAETGGIPETETSNIRIRDRITFVTVKKELAERAIEILAGQVFGGRTVVAEHARDRP